MNEKKIKEVPVYCFQVTLEYLDEFKKDTSNAFTVHYNVVANDRCEAQRILEEWLSIPERTGWRFKKWVGITPLPNDYTLIADNTETALVSYRMKVKPKKCSTKQVLNIKK